MTAGAGMRLGRGEHPQASETRSGLDLSTSAGRHRGALVVVEPTISISRQVEALHDLRDYGDAAEATPVGISRISPPRPARLRRRRGSNPGRISPKQPRSGSLPDLSGRSP